jgi:uncharacterized protein YuzE
MSQIINVSISPLSRQAYFTCSDYEGKIRTVEVNDMVNVDLDPQGKIFGVELIDVSFFEAAIPKLKSFGLLQNDIDEMRNWLSVSALPAA